MGRLGTGVPQVIGNKTSLALLDSLPDGEREHCPEWAKIRRVLARPHRDFELRGHPDEEQQHQAERDAPDLFQRFAAVFPDHAAVEAARESGAITNRQAVIACAYLELEGAGGRNLYAIVTREVRQQGHECSPRTVQRDFANLVKRVRKLGGHVAAKTSASFAAYRVRGLEKRPDYWRVREVRFGPWRRRWLERLTPSEARRFRSTLTQLKPRLLVEMQDTTMRVLLAALVAVVTGDEKRAKALRRRLRLRPGEWQHATEWAQARLRASGWRGMNVHDSSTVLTELVRGLPLCEACHTPILRGALVNGVRVTPRRDGKVCCSAGCKMRAMRRRRRTAGGTGARR